MKLTRKQKKKLSRIIVASAMFAAGVAVSLAGVPYAPLVLFAAAYLAVGYPVLKKAVLGVLHARLLDESFLMAIASVGAFVLGEYSEGAAVMLFYSVGELFESIAVDRSRRSITSLMEMCPDTACVERVGEVLTLSPEEVQVGETVIVKPYEKVPLDGVVTEGRGEVNTAALTGESLPRSVSAGDEVYSGSVNGGSLLKLRVTRPYSSSAAMRILELVESSADKKSRHEAFITRFARFYTPFVVAAALAIALIPSIITGDYSKWVYQGLNFLVISCPCALVISVPLAFFAGIGAASKNGILIKGGNYLEALCEIDTVLFDKTGTLTEGRFTVTEIRPEEGISEAELLTLAAKAESASSHPIARSIAEAAGYPDTADVTDVTEIAGTGVVCKVGAKEVRVGGKRMYESGSDSDGTVTYVICDGVYMGSIAVADTLRPSAAATVSGLHKAGVKRCVMLTGDRESTARTIANELELDAYKAEMLPENKVAALEEELKTGRCAFIGDGINDAPVLTRADVGVAMGGIGSDAAIEAADIVLMDDDPSKAVLAVRIARRTVSIARQNTAFALTVKGAIMVLGLFGAANMWLAVFADVGVAMLAILNAMRAGRKK